MNIMELLQMVDARLRPLDATNESELQGLLEEVAAGPRPEGVAPEVEPRAVLAGRLYEIEVECQILRKQLNVQFTTVTKVEITGLTASGPFHPGSPDPDTPDAAD